jgi:hypothetical protein
MTGELNEEFKKNPDYVRDVIRRAKFINNDDHWYIANLPELTAVESNDHIDFGVRPRGNPDATIDGIGRSIAESYQNYKAAVGLAQLCQSGVTASEFESHFPATDSPDGVHKKSEIFTMASRITELDNGVSLSQPPPNDDFRLHALRDDPHLELPTIHVHGDESDASNLTATCDTKDTTVQSNVRWGFKYLWSKVPSLRW